MSDAEPASEPPLIRLRGVTKRYAEGAGVRAVFDGVDLDIARGEFVVVFGRSGSGKSTLLNLISGIDLADAGELHVLGCELARSSEEERTLLRRAHVGFIFQFFNLIPTLSVGENLWFPLELQGRRGKPAEERARDLLARVKLADRWDAFPDRLSGGEQQRVAIARALAHDPELVLADEPTGNLDDESAALVLQLLQDLLRPARKTLVLVTHNPAFAKIADRTLRVAHGRILDEARRT
ncbi:MAG TPA: ABC transporter ATP-binding protein [Planctomycetota bacterium]|nr:ABC transporter ATP-binding protein [Planctomycetota bacterium]